MRLERRQALWLPILLLHGLLLMASLPRHAAEQPAERPTLAVRLLPAPASARTARPTPPNTPPSRSATPQPAAAKPATVPVPAALPPAEPAAPTESPPMQAGLPAAPASEPLLQTEATRRAIWQATRAPLLSERAAAATDAPARETAQQRLGREVARSAHGNCLKGEFPGGGAGLLSLPMFLIAEASGRCQK